VGILVIHYFHHICKGDGKMHQAEAKMKCFICGGLFRNYGGNKFTEKELSKTAWEAAEDMERTIKLLEEMDKYNII